MNTKNFKKLLLTIVGLVGGFFAIKYGLYYYLKFTHKINYEMKFQKKIDTEIFDVDKEFYKDLEIKCRELKLIYVADIVDSGQNQTYIKSFVDSNGYYTASGYSVKTPDNLLAVYGKYINIYELESETLDGEFIYTTNAEFIKSLKSPIQIKRHIHEISTPLDEIVRFHEKMISEKRIKIRKTYEEILKSSFEEQEIEKKFRDSLGGLQIEEIKELDKEVHEKL